MTKLLSHLVAGPLPAVVFFLTFILAGDVLIAGVVAIVVAIIELLAIFSAHRQPSALIWVSLALVIFLCAATLAGLDASAVEPMPASSVCIGRGCSCPASLRDTMI